MTAQVSEQSKFGFWVTLSFFVSFFMLFFAYNPWDWGLLQQENTGNATRNFLVICWLFGFTVWAVIVGVPLAKNIAGQDHFLLVACVVLVIVGFAIGWSMWNGFFSADDSAAIHILIQVLISLVLAVSSSLARKSQ